MSISRLFIHPKLHPKRHLPTSKPLLSQYIRMIVEVKNQWVYKQHVTSEVHLDSDFHSWIMTITITTAAGNM